MSKRAKNVAFLALLVASFGFLYRDVIINLVQDWAIDDNYSHGFLIVPIALYFVWERRDRLTAARRQPSVLGLILVLGSLGVLLVGLLGSELFLARISLLGTIVGVVLFLYGWQYLRILALPLAFLLLMIPIPRIVFDQIVFPLQLLASRLAEATLSTLGVPVLREGNLIILANTTLEVAEACSGIRSLISLLTLGIVYGYVTDPRMGLRTALAVGTVPVAIIANGLRIAGTGLAARYYGAEAAEVFFDTFSGWILFTVAFFLIFALHRALLWVAPPGARVGQDPGVEGKATRSSEKGPSFARVMTVAVSLIVGAMYLGGASQTEAVPIREPLAEFPMEIASWKGRPTLNFSERIVAKLGVDEYLSRFYSNPSHGRVHLYVGYYESQRQGDTIHSPKNCLPGAGWQPVRSGRVVIPRTGNKTVEVNRYLIQKGTEKQVVLYWYQSHGRTIASEYWAKIYLVLDAIRMNRTDGALIRVVSPVIDSEETAEQRAVDFVKEMFPLLSRHMPV